MQKKILKNRGSWNRKEKASLELPSEDAVLPPTIPEDLPGKKKFVEAWVQRNNIPGKLQAWYSAPSEQENCDWRIRSMDIGPKNRVLSIEGPFKGAKPPKLVLEIDAQIRKPHLSKFRKSILQIWFRATGDGRYGIAVQNILHSAEATREFKSFLGYLQREHAEDVLCCHQIRIRPVQAFDPAHPAAHSHIELMKGFGSEFLPIGNTGKKFNILDWTPAAKGPWTGLPERIREAIHPAKDDKFLECYAGPAFIAESLSPGFSACFAADSRDMARFTPNTRFLSADIGKGFFKKFFRSKAQGDKWTIYLDPPDGLLPGGIATEIAAAHPERILLNVSNPSAAALEIKRFRREGYMLRKIIPLDMEPGKPSIHLLLLFVPDRAGLLGRRAEHAQRAIKRQESPGKAKFAAEAVHFSQKSKR